MSGNKNSRRQFLRNSGATLSAGWVALNMPLLLAVGEAAHASLESGAAYQNISAALATELGAFANQIIPPDDTPGAVDIGVVYFMDGALGGFMAGTKPMIEAGLASWDQKAQVINPEVEHFSQLTIPQQTEMLKIEEQTPLFGLLRTMVLWGMFSSPQYGGNRDDAGWQLLGFNKQHAWSPPFGYYDAEAMGITEYDEAPSHGESHA